MKTTDPQEEKWKQWAISYACMISHFLESGHFPPPEGWSNTNKIPQPSRPQGFTFVCFWSQDFAPIPWSLGRGLKPETNQPPGGCIRMKEKMVQSKVEKVYMIAYS